MGYNARFENVLMRVTDYYDISLPFLYQQQDDVCEAIFFYAVSDYWVQVLGDIALRSISTGEIKIMKLNHILSNDDIEDISTSPVVFCKDAHHVDVRKEYLQMHDAAVECGGRITQEKHKHLGELMMRLIPQGGVSKLYRAVAKEYF